jgi:hypothetical protein
MCGNVHSFPSEYFEFHYPNNKFQNAYPIRSTANTPIMISVIFASCRRCILTISNLLGQLPAEAAVVGVLVPDDRWVLR